MREKGTFAAASGAHEVAQLVVSLQRVAFGFLGFLGLSVQRIISSLQRVAYSCPLFQIFYYFYYLYFFVGGTSLQ